MALVGDTLYVANTDALMAFPYKLGETRINAKGRKILALPSQAPNFHWTRNLIASPDGSLLYVAVGSASNIAEYGLDKEENRRSEEHTSELQSLMRISYAVFCLTKKKNTYIKK